MLGNAETSLLFCRVHLVNEVGLIVHCHGDVFDWRSVCVVACFCFGTASTLHCVHFRVFCCSECGGGFAVMVETRHETIVWTSMKVDMRGFLVES